MEADEFISSERSDFYQTCVLCKSYINWPNWLVSEKNSDCSLLSTLWLTIPAKTSEALPGLKQQHRGVDSHTRTLQAHAPNMSISQHRRHKKNCIAELGVPCHQQIIFFQDGIFF